MTQNETLTILKTGTNVFLTGEPGSGKTHVVNSYISWLRDHEIPVAITASTGIAATHIGGSTIHSWSGIGIKRKLTAHDLSDIRNKNQVVQRIKNSSVLIIDEISMLTSDTLAMVENVCRKIRDNKTSFGGLQVVLVGDFFQLPPIIGLEPNRQGSPIAPDSQDSQFAFSSVVWQTLNLRVCYLSEQHRQEDVAFLELLSALRQATITTAHRALLQARLTKKTQSSVTQLFSHNIDVDHVNNIELKKLSGTERIFTMTSRGPTKLVAQLQRGCLSPERLALKIGAKVMFTKNDPAFKFVNGTLGTVVGFSKENSYPIIDTLTRCGLVAEPMEWHLEDGSKILARIAQIPLRLAWAITVHKSQGMSLDAAHMDLSQVFEYGQGYVALSRVRTLAGLTLAGINEHALKVHPAIQIKDLEFRQASQATSDEFASIPEAKLLQKQGDFIRLCGGSIDVKNSVRKEKTPNSTYENTRLLLLQKLSIPAMATARALTQGTILSHIEKLVAQKKINPQQELKHLRPEPKRYEKIKQAFGEVYKNNNELRLTPVREALGEDFSFEELRIVRLFL